MIEAGYRLVRIDDGAVIETWGGVAGQSPAVPNFIAIPAIHAVTFLDADGQEVTENRAGFDHVHCPSIDGEYGGYRLEKWLVEIPAPTRAQVNFERDRRIEAGFEFQGVTIQFDASSQANILGACQLAAMNELPTDFVWIAADNTLLPLDATGVIAMGRTGAAFKSRVIFAARALKEMSPIPTDFGDDKWWP